MSMRSVACSCTRLAENPLTRRGCSVGRNPTIRRPDRRLRRLVLGRFLGPCGYAQFFRDAASPPPSLTARQLVSAFSRPLSQVNLALFGDKPQIEPESHRAHPGGYSESSHG